MCRCRRVFDFAKQAALSLLAIALLAGAVLTRGIDPRDDPRPQFARMSFDARRERIERSRFGEALEHPLVEQAEVELVAQRMKRRDAPLIRAHFQQRLDRAFTDVLDRG